MIDFWVSAFWMAGHAVVLVSSVILWVHVFSRVYAYWTRQFYLPSSGRWILFFLSIVNAAIFRHYWLML